MKISSEYIKAVFQKKYLLKNLLLLFCVLCIYKYACVTHSFVVNKMFV